MVSDAPLQWCKNPHSTSTLQTNTPMAGTNCQICSYDLQEPMFKSATRPIRPALLWVYEMGAAYGCTFCGTVVAVVETINQTVAEVKSIQGPSIYPTLDGRFYLSFYIEFKLDEPLYESSRGLSNGRLSIYPQGSSSFAAQCVPYYRAPANPSWQKMKEWLSRCKSSHPGCYSAQGDFVPSRLLDIISLYIPSDVDPRIVLRSELPNRPEYLALSYCWGKAQPLTTTAATLDQYRIGIPIRVIPQTISDAIAVARALGFRYLWIDCICIIQDDEQDWIDESRMMGSIYSNAEIVIAATRASAATEGFLGMRTVHRTGIARSSFRAPHAAPATYRITRELQPGQAEGPLDSRGWAFQERILARRYLSFGPDEMQWVCREEALSESGEKAFLIAKPIRPFDRMVNGTDRPPAQIWREEILRPYLSRELTRPSDNLVALSAVAARFHSVIKGDYLAGLWSKDLIQQLLWYSTRGNQASGFPRSQYAPTWSWASVRGERHYRSFAESSDVADLAEIVGTSVILATSNEYGPVKDGRIRIRGKLIEATLETLELSITQSCVTIDDVHLGISDLDMPVVPYAMPAEGNGDPVLHARRIPSSEPETHQETKHSTYNTITSGLRKQRLQIRILPLMFEAAYGITYALILGPSPTVPGCFERLGINNFGGGPGTRWEKVVASCETREVVLV